MRRAAILAARTGGRSGSRLRGFATVASVLDERVAQMPTKDVLRIREIPGLDEGIRWTLADLKTHSEALACGILQLGCSPGDTIAVILPSNAEHVAVHYAAAKAGLVVAEVQGTPTAESLAALLDETKCRGLIVDGSHEMTSLVRSVLPEVATRLVPDRPLDYFPHGLPSERFPELNFVVHTGMKDIKDEVKRPLRGMYSIAKVLMYNAIESPFEDIEAGLSAESPMLRQLTLEGSNVVANGPTLTHGQVLEQSESERAKIGFGADDKVCLATDKDAALVLGHIACMQSFAQLVVPSAVPDQEKVTSVTAEEKCGFQWS